MTEDKLDFPSPSEAYIDSETGMYRMREPKQFDGDMTTHIIAGPDGDTEIYIPVPKVKPCRRVQITQYNYLDIAESLDYVKQCIDEARTPGVMPIKLYPGEVYESLSAEEREARRPQWFSFTDPRYGTMFAVPRHVMANALWVIEAWVDLELEKLQIQNAEAAKQQLRMQLIKSRKGN